jgi:hypothetical protein
MDRGQQQQRIRPKTAGGTRRSVIELKRASSIDMAAEAL